LSYVILPYALVDEVVLFMCIESNSNCVQEGLWFTCAYHSCAGRDNTLFTHFVNYCFCAWHWEDNFIYLIVVHCTVGM